MSTCHALTSEADIERLAAPWRVLQAEKGLSPFTDFDWVFAWWTSVGKPEGSSLFVVVCFEGERLKGVLPFAIAPKAGVRILRFAGHDVFYIRNLLAEDEATLEAMWRVVRDSRDYDFADIKNIHEGTAEEKILRSFASVLQREPVYYREHIGLTRRNLFEPYTKRFRRKLYKIAETLAKKPEYTFGVCEDGSFLNEAMPFLVEEKRAWCKENGKSGIFNSARVEDFYRAVSEVGIRQKSFRLFWLRKSGRLVAVLLCFVSAGTLYAHTVAHDPSVRSVHPGLFLKAEAMAWACEQGLRETNFMEGQEYFKVRFSSGERPAYEFILSRSLKGRLFAAAYRARHFLQRLRRRKEDV